MRNDVFTSFGDLEPRMGGEVAIEPRHSRHRIKAAVEMSSITLVVTKSCAETQSYSPE